MVSATPSSFAGLAQGMILGDTGILINCRGCYFWLDPDNPNVLAPHKRPRTTPCTFIVLKQGHPYMTPRDLRRRQPAAELLASVYQYRRFWIKRAGGSRGAKVLWLQLPPGPWPHRAYPNCLQVEARLAPAVIDALNARGHQVEVVGPWGVRNGFTPFS